MEVTVSNQEEDLIALNDHLAKTHPVIRRQILIAWLCLPLFFVMIGLGLIRLSGVMADGYVAFGVAFLVLLFLPSFLKLSRRRNIQRLIRAGRNLGILGPQKIVLTPQEIGRHNRYGHSAFYWPAVERIEVGLSHAFVFVTSVNAFLLPKRDFPSEADFDLFVETAKKYHRDANDDPLRP